MAQIPLRINLAASRFPFSSSFFGRSVIVPGYDENFDRQLLQQGQNEGDKDKGIPQAYYMHNVMPTEHGYESIGYDSRVAGIPGDTNFDSIRELKDPSDNRFHYSFAGGRNRFLDGLGGGWTSVSPFPAGTFSGVPLITTCILRNTQYMYFEKFGCYIVTTNPFALTPVTLAGLVPSNIRGIAASNGYMIAWDNSTVYWSNAALETDFVPSLLTGAGSGGVGDSRGRIVVCISLINGFNIYTTQNVVGATYSGNLRYPFILKEVGNSAGVNNIEQISFAENAPFHYAMTSGGIQKVDKVLAQSYLPELSDFFGMKIFEDFDEVALAFTITYPSSLVNTKLVLVAERYLILSYGVGPGSFTHAIIYDMLIKRWGKVKITHVAALEYIPANFYGTRTYAQLLGNTYAGLFGTSYTNLSIQQSTAGILKGNIGFLQQDGTIQTINFDLGSLTHNGVICLGKYQFQRQRKLTLQSAEFENIVVNAANFSVYVLTSDNGKTFRAALAMVQDLVNSSGEYRKYWTRSTGLNHTILLKGAFNIVSGQLWFTPHGRR
jgi:hypothetical protein